MIGKLKNKISKRLRNILAGYLFVFPWLVGFLLFTLWPMIYSLYLGFHEVRLTPRGIKTEFVQVTNFKEAIFSDPQLLQNVFQYLQEIILQVPVIIVFALIIALLINQDIRGQSVFRTVFFLPVIIMSGPVIEQLMAQEATTIPGIEDYALFAVIENIDWVLMEPIKILFQEIIMVLWFSGVQILIFLAGLQKIDQSTREAAMIDGASFWEMFWKITLPAVKPLIIVNTIYTVIDISTFELNAIIIYIREQMFNVSTGFGYSSALGWLYFVLISILLIISVVILNIRDAW